MNKTLLGTIKGSFIVFDQLSKHYKMKKLSNFPILQIKIIDYHAYIFCSNEKVVIYDILRN